VEAGKTSFISMKRGRVENSIHNTEVEAKKIKIYDSESVVITTDSVRGVVSMVGSIPVLSRMSAVCKGWKEIVDERILEVVTRMQWYMYVVSTRGSMCMIVSLGKIKGVDKSCYSILHKGVGGDTSYMIHRCMRGETIYAEVPFLYRLSLPPRLVDKRDGIVGHLYPVHGTTQMRVENGSDPHLHLTTPDESDNIDREKEGRTHKIYWRC
jgi:hypothetical protein